MPVLFFVSAGGILVVGGVIFPPLAEQFPVAFRTFAAKDKTIDLYHYEKKFLPTICC